MGRRALQRGCISGSRFRPCLGPRPWAYILVNENACQNADSLVRDSFVSDLRQCHVVESSLSRGELIQRLDRLRRHHPDAKILGLSELGPHCVRPSEAMNALRRELSEQREYVSF